MQTSLELKLDREPQARQFVRQLDYNAGSQQGRVEPSLSLLHPDRPAVQGDQIQSQDSALGQAPIELISLQVFNRSGSGA